MKIIIDNKELSRSLVRIIETAENKLWFITPYVQLETSKGKRWDDLIDALNGAKNRGVDLNFIFRKNQSSDPNDEIKILGKDRIETTLIQDLHAKIYCNEESVLLTSMNLYAHSYAANYEIGVYLTKEDRSEFGKIFTYIEKLKRKGTLPSQKTIEEIKEKEQTPQAKEIAELKTWVLKKIKEDIFIDALVVLNRFGDFSKNQVISILIEIATANEDLVYVKDQESLEKLENVGYCIICGEIMERDFQKKYVRCRNCYHEGHAKGKYCHYCGKSATTYPNNPVCKECLKKEPGYCIECKKKISFDPYLNIVRCKSCWKKNKNGIIHGNYCFMCGQSNSGSLEKPLCPDCYKQPEIPFCF